MLNKLKNKKTSLLFFGDFCVKDTSSIIFSDDVQNIIEKSDIRAINFEAPLKSNDTIKKSGPSLFQIDDSPTWLEEKGFNLVTLANNHIMDFGVEGFQNTISRFHNAILLGAGEKSEAYNCKYIEINGIKIGFIALVHCEFGILRSDEKGIGTAWINDSIVDELILESKSKCDYLIILPHAGVEEIDIPLPEWRARYKKFIDLGADAVIASHPHTPQGWEAYMGKIIFYSLGNCIFHLESSYRYWNNGLAVMLNISDGTISYEVYPTIFKENTLSLDNSDEIWLHLKKVNSFLIDKISYDNKLNEEVLKLWRETYTLYFEWGLGVNRSPQTMKDLLRVLYCYIFRKTNKADYATLLNNMRCESHRWCIQRALELIYKY